MALFQNMYSNEASRRHLQVIYCLNILIRIWSNYILVIITLLHSQSNPITCWSVVHAGYWIVLITRPARTSKQPLKTEASLPITHFHIGHTRNSRGIWQSYWHKHISSKVEILPKSFHETIEVFPASGLSNVLFLILNVFKVQWHPSVIRCAQ